MPLHTRIDGRSPTNKILEVKDELGRVVATIEATGKTADLSIDTSYGYYVEKPKEATNE